MRFKNMLLVGFMSLCSLNANADVQITIYNQDLALIKKSKTHDLQKGINHIIFDEIAQNIKPESVIIYGDNFKVIEQNFDNTPINYSNLLKLNIGKVVKTLRINPKTGEKEFNTATLIATDGFNPILKFDYGIEANFDGKIIFDNIAEELNNTPILKTTLEAINTANTDINIAYLTTGFNWKANYVAKIIDDKTLELNGRVELNNHSGSNYNNADISLIAGEVNTVRDVMPRLAKTFSMATYSLNSVSTDSIITAPETLNGFYLYKLPFKTKLNNNQTKMVSFVNTNNVTYQKENELHSPLTFGMSKDNFENIHPTMTYHIKNIKEDGLGIPLPEGKMSFYANDKNSTLQFIGENSIKNTAIKEELSLNLGKNFDIFASGKVINTQKISERKFKKKPTDRCVTIENAYIYDVEYNITNSSQYDTNITLYQPLHNNSTVIKESINGALSKENLYKWNITIPKDKTETLNASLKGILELKDCSQ